MGFIVCWTLLIGHGYKMGEIERLFASQKEAEQYKYLVRRQGGRADVIPPNPGRPEYLVVVWGEGGERNLRAVPRV